MAVIGVGNYDKLRQSVSNLRSLSQEITSTLERTQQVYEQQSSGWSSARSTQESGKMVNYSEEAKRIAKLIDEISNLISGYANVTEMINEE